jgi:hypothetical protein
MSEQTVHAVMRTTFYCNECKRSWAILDGDISYPPEECPFCEIAEGRIEIQELRKTIDEARIESADEFVILSLTVAEYRKIVGLDKKHFTLQEIKDKFLPNRDLDELRCLSEGKSPADLPTSKRIKMPTLCNEDPVLVSHAFLNKMSDDVAKLEDAKLTEER